MTLVIRFYNSSKYQPPFSSMFFREEREPRRWNIAAYRSPSVGVYDVWASETESMKMTLPATILLLGSLALAQGSQATAPPAREATAQTATPSQPKTDSAKEADIRKLMQVTGAQKLTTQMLAGMETSLKPSLANPLPPGEYRAQLVDLFLDKFRAKVSVAAVDASVPVYDKYFSDEEIRQMIAFYETPIGKKTVSVLPQLMTEAMAASQEMAGQLSRDCMAEVLAERPDLKQAMEQAGKSQKSQ